MTRIRITIAALLLCVTTHAYAGVRAQLVGPNLDAQPVTLQSLRGDTVSYFGEDRAYQRSPVSAFLQLRIVEERAEPEATGMLTLTDGQRIAGEWLGGADDGQAIRWKHPALGEMRFSLERTSRWRGPGAIGSPPRELDDRVELANGDVLRGFVLAAGAELSVQMQMDGGPQTVKVDMARISRVNLANPPALPQDPQRHVVHLADGSQVRVVELTIEDDRFTVRRTADDEPIAAPLSDLLRVDFAAAGLAVADVADLERRTTGGSVFGMTLKPRLHGTTLHLHAPMTVTFTLPDGAKRFAATAELDAGPHEPAAWASFDVIVRAGGDEIARHTISASQPRAAINLTLDGATTLTLDLEPGVNGPIMDRLRLRDAVVLRALPDAQ